jgi:NADH:ubiquinone oxidoreductase subunit D
MGQPTWLRRLVSWAASQDLTAFVVPGMEIARARGLDPAAAGLCVVASPRHAAVLLLVGELPDGLARAAAVAYAQMARPRAILAVGVRPVPSLPTPDVSVTLDQRGLAAGVTRLRRLFAAGAWMPDAPVFDVPEVKPPEEEHKEMQHGAQGDQHGQVDHGGMEGMQHGQMAHTRHGGMMTHGDMGGMQHGGMGGGFMSMVRMTKDLPRSPDGLPMEWVEAPFGPLFPGLPGGLALTFTLDGNTVQQAHVTRGTVTRRLTESWPGPAVGFPDRFARLDPLVPVTYRLLAHRTLEDAGGSMIDDATACRCVGALERECAASHLGWLASFGFQLGDDWLAQRAAALQHALLHATAVGMVAHLQPRVADFVRRVHRVPLLQRRLAGIGRLGANEAVGMCRPVARAAGHTIDARLDDPLYRRLGFAPIVRDGNDALARLWVRLAEVEQSLALVLAAHALSTPDTPVPANATGTGRATVETPRGAATLSLMLAHGDVRDVTLDTPSMHHVRPVESVAEGQEVADALAGVASLDLSPWEADR